MAVGSLMSRLEACRLPEESAKFARHSDGGLILMQATGLESAVAVAEPTLGTPGEDFYFSRQALLASGELGADVGPGAIGLGAFDEHPSCVAIAAFGDCSKAPSGTTAVFAGN